MKRWKIIAPLVIAAFVIVLFMGSWQNQKFDETRQYLAGIKPSEIETILVTIDQKTQIVDSPDQIEEFLTIVSNLETFDWGKTNDKTSDVNFSIEPLDIRIDGHRRSGDPEHIYGYLGRQHDNTFINYGNFKSAALSTWTVQHMANDAPQPDASRR